VTVEVAAAATVSVIEDMVRRLLPKPPVVGVITSIGPQGWGGPLVATISGVLEGTLTVPQKQFTSWFLHEATTTNVTGLRVLVLFTEGDQLVLMSSLPPIGV
jgi:hypothetical protein